MKKLILTAIAVSTLLLCGCRNENDCIQIWNEDSATFDDININIKTGYYYESHEKFTVDDNTIGITVYFTNDEGWD